MGFLEKKAGGTATNSTASHGVTIITAGCHFHGKLFCRGVSRIGGSIEGEIVAEGILIIEEDAIIKANIKAAEVVIQGKVEGKLHAETRVELISTGTFSGELVTPNLHIEEGALLNGTTTMVSKAASVENIKDLKRKKKNESNSKNQAPIVEPNVSLSNSESAKTPEVGIK
jgi:cytoskeletal protein CcmA (bactofilin family)